MGGGICGAALRRAADAMLKALGNDTVNLLLPGSAMASDAAGQLGLVDPGVQEMVISPVAVRALQTGNLGPRRRIEITMPASVIGNLLPGLGMATAEDLFNVVLGLNYGGDLFHIEKMTTESFAGTECFHVVTAVE
jgi:hypothetical protein